MQQELMVMVMNIVDASTHIAGCRCETDFYSKSLGGVMSKLLLVPL